MPHRSTTVLTNLLDFPAAARASFETGKQRGSKFQSQRRNGIALKAPAQFCKSHEFLDWRVSWQRTEEVFGRLGFSSGPLDEQALLLGGLGRLARAGGAAHPYCRK